MGCFGGIIWAGYVLYLIYEALIYAGMFLWSVVKNIFGFFRRKEKD